MAQTVKNDTCAALRVSLTLETVFFDFPQEDTQCDQQHTCCNRRALSFKNMETCFSQFYRDERESEKLYFEWLHPESIPNILGVSLHTC